jgi:putative endonuclease
MRNQKDFYVYIAANYTNNVLYVGITNSIARRMHEHKNKLIKGFTEKYNINKLVFAATFPTALEAIAAEKKIKGWTRAKKKALIKSQNPEWKNLIN